MSTSSEMPWKFAAATPIQNFHYPTIQASPLVVEESTPESKDGSEASERTAQEAALREAEMQAHTAALESAWERGLREGEARGRAAVNQALEQERRAIKQTLQEFAAERAAYFRRVESDVVRLALAIARKILHREAQVDPLLLAGIVRVGLDQMQQGSRVVVKTSARNAEAWRRCLAEEINEQHQLEVVADESLEDHRCILQSEVGSTEISLDGQLQEIERGFFDLLSDHPGTSL